jgi:hypothetical protein
VQLPPCDNSDIHSILESGIAVKFEAIGEPYRSTGSKPPVRFDNRTKVWRNLRSIPTELEWASVTAPIPVATRNHWSLFLRFSMFRACGAICGSSAVASSLNNGPLCFGDGRKLRPRGNRQVLRDVYESRRIREVSPPAPLNHNYLLRRSSVYAHRDIIIEVIGQPRWSVTKIRILLKHALGKAHIFESYTIPHHNWNAVKSTLQ